MLRTALALARFRGLLATLTTRELKARYRGSFLGFFWSLANPLLLLAVYSFVFGVVFRRPLGEGVEPYALFLITGLFPWVWVSSSMLEGSMTFISHAGLLRKAVFPLEVLPTVAVLSNLAHFLLAVPILAAALLVGRALGHDLGGPSALLFPLVVLIQLPMVGGLVLGLAALNVHFKDVRDIVANLLTLLFFLTPILYPLEAVTIPALWWLVRLNPFTPYALAYQQTLFYGVVPDPELWAQMLLVALVSWAGGTWLFGRLRETLVEAA
ncbi:MAG TPA: ABC transporter permease [Thermoanaerobaculia bacterium]|nr:ABC transporter permease [Thermoanaerobaculia bacterium]